MQHFEYLITFGEVGTNEPQFILYKNGDSSGGSKLHGLFELFFMVLLYSVHKETQYVDFR